MCISPLMFEVCIIPFSRQACCTTLHLFPFSHPRTSCVRRTPRSLHQSLTIASETYISYSSLPTYSSALQEIVSSIQFVDTYSFHPFPPPSRRPQQIQPFPQSGAGVSHVKLGVEELGVGEWSEVESGCVSGSGRFSGCFATDSAVHRSLLPTPQSFHCCHTAL